MKKLLFLSEAVSLAHVGRPLTLANWAFENGYEVHFACSKEGLTKTGTKNFPFSIHSLASIKSSLFYERVNKGQFFYSFDEMVAYIEEEKELIHQINPDLIITDFRLSAPISARLCNKPLLNLSNAHWSPNAECAFPAPNAGIFNWFPKSIREKVFSLIRPIAFKTFGKELNKVRNYYGLPEKSDFRELYTDGTFTAYLDMPDFTTIEKLPKNHFFLGPVIWNPPATAQKIELKDTNNIYISMGSTGNNKLIDPIINSALKTDSFIILSGVSFEEELTLISKYPALKNRSVIKNLIDPASILPKCRLTICHGGSGTVYQSLSHGTPVLCFPANPDQCLVSYVVDNKKLGKFIEEGKPTQSSIENAILEILHNKVFAQKAKQYSLAILSQNTFQNWLKFLSNLFPKPILQETILKDTPMKKNYRPSGVSIAFNQTLNSIKAKEEIKPKAPSGYTIKLANTLEEREAAYRLAYKVYLDKGYVKENPYGWLVKDHDANPETATLIVQDKEKNVVGSITMIFDGKHSIPAKSIYYNEILALKAKNEKIVEISRLVIDNNHRNAKEILVILFNYLYIYSSHVKKYTCLTIEVNPRHREFYRLLLGFDVIGKEKPCPNVLNAPAILLCSSLDPKINTVLKQRCESPEKKSRSAVSYFVKPEQEGLVAAYLEKQYKPMTEEEKLYFGFTDSTIGKTLCV
jgi:UDP:flavonoid glycosyltransferase YjiC (YdhE family)